MCKSAMKVTFAQFPYSGFHAIHIHGKIISNMTERMKQAIIEGGNDLSSNFRISIEAYITKESEAKFQSVNHAPKIQRT